MLVFAAYACGLMSAYWLDWRFAVIVASNCFFCAYLAVALTSLDNLNKDKLKTVAVTSDAPVFVIYLITLSTVTTAMISLFTIINAEARASSIERVLAMASVPLGWATIHMMSAFHYAHLYWRRNRDGQPRLGLEFPGKDEPDGWDFVYFSFVIGVAAQTSDVAISGRSIRRFTLAHSIIAYFFNAVLIAAAVNIVVAS